MKNFLSLAALVLAFSLLPALVAFGAYGLAGGAGCCLKR